MIRIRPAALALTGLLRGDAPGRARRACTSTLYSCRLHFALTDELPWSGHLPGVWGWRRAGPGTPLAWQVDGDPCTRACARPARPRLAHARAAPRFLRPGPA